MGNTTGSTGSTGGKEETLSCELCGNPLEACMCVCPYCGERDACECCLHDAVTGGG
ncbi:MAG TPA: hypothetical protein VGW09_11575 [Nitrososphaeraceae archaeon]|nr:hypothetical protein [Nitrososphaeraceae archaeon]